MWLCAQRQAGLLHGPLRLVTNPRPPLLAQEGLEGLLGGWTLGLGKAEGDLWLWVPCPNAVGPLSGSSDNYTLFLFIKGWRGRGP